jgi:hypothetical protein
MKISRSVSVSVLVLLTVMRGVGWAQASRPLDQTPIRVPTIEIRSTRLSTYQLSYSASPTAYGVYALGSAPTQTPPAQAPLPNYGVYLTPGPGWSFSSPAYGVYLYTYSTSSPSTVSSPPSGTTGYSEGY